MRCSHSYTAIQNGLRKCDDALGPSESDISTCLSRSEDVNSTRPSLKSRLPRAPWGPLVHPRKEGEAFKKKTCENPYEHDEIPPNWRFRSPDRMSCVSARLVWQPTM